MGLTSDEENESNEVAGCLTPKKKLLSRGGDASKSDHPKHRSQKYRKEWEKQFKHWLRPVASDQYRAQCTLCDSSFRADISMVKRHFSGDKHKLKASSGTFKGRELMNNFIAKGNTINPLNKQIKHAEIKLSAFVAAHNMPFSSMDHLVEVLSDCFPDSKIANGINLKRTKVTGVVNNVIGFHEKSRMATILQTTKFSILTDESTDISTVKTACVIVRYYDAYSGKIVSRFWDLVQVFLVSDSQCVDKGATAEHLFKILIESFEKYDIRSVNIIGFGSDGCNTMMGKTNSVMSRIKELCPGITIMKCICHSLHLCASEACKMIPRSCEDMARNVYNYFKNSSKRQAQLAQFQKFFDLNVHKMLHPSQTRWLSLVAVVDRIIEQWEPLKLFFNDQWLAERLHAAENIHQGLNNPFIQTYFYILQWMLPKFCTLNKLFQSEKTMITILHEKMSITYIEILTLYMNRDYVCKTPLQEICPDNADNFLPLQNIYLGVNVMKQLSKPNMLNQTKLIKEFYFNCRQFLIVSCSQIKKRYNFDDKLMPMYQLLSPSKALCHVERNTTPSLLPFCVMIPRCASECDYQNIDDEWRILPTIANKFTGDIIKTIEPDIFWNKVK